jgi:hypothetical protein
MGNSLKDAPIFSIVAPAYRNKMYEDVYNSFSKNNDISFEIIFVGDRPPQKKMPENFKYIFTTVKLSQCLEIAVRESIGKFIIVSPDDCLVSNNYLSILNNYINTLDMKKNFILPGWKWRNKIRKGYVSIANVSLIVSSTPCILKELWHYIGGIDKRFFTMWGLLDLYLRLIQLHISQREVSDCYMIEIDPSHDKLFTEKLKIGVRFTSSKARKIDHHISNCLWSNKFNSLCRNSPVEPFSDDNILEVSQGPNMIIPR